MAAQAKKRYKSFTYYSSLEWDENRSGTITDKEKPAVRVSSPPEFKGEEGLWSPEDLFVASVNICTMTTFLAFAAKKGISLEEYSSEGEGKLEFVEGAYQFTEIHLSPQIVVESINDVEVAKETIKDAHKKCLISRSMKAEVLINPQVRVASAV